MTQIVAISSVFSILSQIFAFNDVVLCWLVGNNDKLIIFNYSGNRVLCGIFSLKMEIHLRKDERTSFKNSNMFSERLFWDKGQVFWSCPFNF